jgi:steroid delta-isomerase-like uncharacterized protein
MAGDEAVAAARRYLEAVNRHDVDAMMAVLAPSYVHHWAAGDLDPAAVRSAISKYFVSFPDLQYDVVEILPLADGQSVVARWTMRGTHLGRAFGAAPTGRTFASRA